MSESLERLADEIREISPLLADAAVPSGLTGPNCEAAEVAASGPRAASDPKAYALVVEAIREGYLLHYGKGRVIRPDDPDLALLAGDQLFALGLAHLAEIGDIPAVLELADLISLTAQAQAEHDGDRAEAIWASSARAVGWGSNPVIEDAKELARNGDPSALKALLLSAGDADTPPVAS